MAARLGSGRSRLSFGPLLLALGFAAGHAGLFGLPALPSEERTLAGTDWVAWLALVGGAVLVVDARLGIAAVAPRLLLGAAMLALVLRAAIEYQWEGAEVAWRLGLLAALGVALGAAAIGSARTTEGPSAPLALLVATTGLAVCAGLTGSARLGQAAGLVCAGLGALAIVRKLAPGRAFAAGDAAWVVLVAYGLGLCAHYYSELGAADALLLAAGAIAPRLADLRPFAGLAPGRRGMLRVALALVPVGVAVTRAVLAFEPDPYGDYDY